MKIGGALSVFSQIINFMIFIYFIIVLLSLNVLDAKGLFIGAFGLLASLISDIVSTLEAKELEKSEKRG